MSNPVIVTIVHAAGDEAVVRLQSTVTDGMEEDRERLTRVDSVAPGWDPATEVHIGSFNGLDEPKFRRQVLDANWQRPDRLQLFIRRQDDPIPTEVEVFDERIYARVMRQAVNRGLSIKGSAAQIEFFNRLSGERDGNLSMPHQFAEASPAWTFEVVAFGPEYQFEFSKVVQEPDGRQCWHPSIWAKSVDFAFDGIGVRWQNPVNPEAVDESVQAVVRSLNPGDQVEIEGRIESRSGGAAEITQVTSIRRLA